MSKSYIVGAGLLVAAAATYLSSKSTSGGRSPSGDITDIDDDGFGEEDFITEEDVCKIFDRLFIEMQAVLMKLSQQVQQIQMSGQQIPEQQLMMLLKGEFERALMVKQKQVFEEHDVDEDCLEEAVWEFMEQDNEKVKRAIERFQRLWEQISGEKVVGKRPGQESKESEVEVLSAEKVVEAAEVYFGALTNAMSEIVDGIKMQGKDMREQSVAQELHMQFASVANDKGEEALKSMGISLAQFQKSIEQNASNPQVGRQLAVLQMQQQQALMALGVPSM